MDVVGEGCISITEYTEILGVIADVALLRQGSRAMEIAHEPVEALAACPVPPRHLAGEGANWVD